MAHVVGNVSACAIGDSGYLTSCVVGISCHNRAHLVGDLNNVALQFFVEIIRYIVVNDTADRVLIVVEGNQSAIAQVSFRILGW